MNKTLKKKADEHVLRMHGHDSWDEILDSAYKGRLQDKAEEIARFSEQHVNIMTVIKQLVGPIEPVADSSIDRIREENLDQFIQIWEEMHIMIDEIAYKYKDSKFGSCQRLASKADAALDRAGIKGD